MFSYLYMYKRNLAKTAHRDGIFRALPLKAFNVKNKAISSLI